MMERIEIITDVFRESQVAVRKWCRRPVIMSPYKRSEKMSPPLREYDWIRKDLGAPSPAPGLRRVAEFW